MAATWEGFALGLVNDWSPPNPPYIQVPEKMEPPIGFEPTTYGLRNRRTSVQQWCTAPGVADLRLARLHKIQRKIRQLTEEADFILADLAGEGARDAAE